MRCQWAKIYREQFGLPNITLHNATIEDCVGIQNFVVVTGYQDVEVERRFSSELPKKNIEIPLGVWNIKRLFGIKTRTVPEEDSTGWKLIGAHSDRGFVENVYARFESVKRSYRLDRTWVEFCP